MTMTIRSNVKLGTWLNITCLSRYAPTPAFQQFAVLS